MKALLATVALLLATSATAQQKQYDNVAYYSANGESLVLMKAACDLPGFPAHARKATYVASMTFVSGCYVVKGPDQVVVTMPNGVSRSMHRREFQQWEIQ